MINKKILRLVVGLILAVYFIFLVIREINIDEIKGAFVGATTAWIICGLVAFSIGYACRIERWRLMLNRDNSDLKWLHCAGPFLGSFAANNILPFRAGDVMRAFAFNNRLGVKSGVVVATLFVERLLDLLMVLVLLGAALAIFGLDASGFTGIGGAALIAITLVILQLLLFPQLLGPVAVISGRLAACIAPKLGGKILDGINRSMKTLLHLSKGGTMIRLVAWSIAAWLAEGCLFWFAALALSSIGAPEAGWLALPVGTLATLIPSTPGYVGTFDYFTVRAMSMLGNSTVASTAYALLVHLLLWIPPTLIGALYLLLHPANKPKDLKVF